MLSIGWGAVGVGTYGGSGERQAALWAACGWAANMRAAFLQLWQGVQGAVLCVRLACGR